jgi:hypothetical protein
MHAVHVPEISTLTEVDGTSKLRQFSTLSELFSTLSELFSTLSELDPGQIGLQQFISDETRMGNVSRDWGITQVLEVSIESYGIFES